MSMDYKIARPTRAYTKHVELPRSYFYKIKHSIHPGTVPSTPNIFRYIYAYVNEQNHKPRFHKICQSYECISYCK